MWVGIICVLLGVGATYIVTAIGVAYPAFMSFIALESKGTGDDKQWLTYWVVFGLLNIVDQWTGFILSFIPFLYRFRSKASFGRSSIAEESIQSLVLSFVRWAASRPRGC